MNKVLKRGRKKSRVAVRSDSWQISSTLAEVPWQALGKLHPWQQQKCQGAKGGRVEPTFNWHQRILTQQHPTVLGRDSLRVVFMGLFRNLLESPWHYKSADAWGAIWGLNQHEYRSLYITCDRNMNCVYLLGGFNPSQKYWSKWIISPGSGEDNQKMKPPPRYKKSC